MANPNPTAANPSAASQALRDIEGPLASVVARLEMLAEHGALRDAHEGVLVVLHDTLDDASDALARLSDYYKQRAIAVPACTALALPDHPNELAPLDRAAFALAFSEECAKARPDEPAVAVMDRAMRRVRAFLAERDAARNAA